MRHVLLTLLLTGCFQLTDKDKENAEDQDNDGHKSHELGGDDCDDDSPEVHPGATELCNAIDDDCDGLIDDQDPDTVGLGTWYPDQDQDSYGLTEKAITSCDQPASTASRGGDCDDTDASFHPGAAEDDCTDPGDHNCDGLVAWADDDLDGTAACEDCDDQDPQEHPGASWYVDSDGDGWGTEGATEACERPTGMVPNSGDCNDSDYTVFPKAPELCNGLDDDCDDHVDEDPSDVTWYEDRDGDDWGSAHHTVTDCEQPEGYAYRPGDCDDDLSVVHPGAAETCSGLDDDCDGLIDAADPDMSGDAIWYRDSDEDTFGDPSDTLSQCSAPEGYVLEAGDCDDTNDSIHPDAAELCDEVDNDCDALIDDEDPSREDPPGWFLDSDGDLYGVEPVAVWACVAPPEHVAVAGDCAPDNLSIYPGADEQVADAVDQDCDGGDTCFFDEDGDSYGSASLRASADLSCFEPGESSNPDDCDDSDPLVHPASTELCNGIDDDCDGQEDEPEAADATEWYADLDLDGYGDPASSTRACEPSDPYVFDSRDCDDTSAAIHPGADELCNGIDDDCDDIVDGPTVIDAPTWYLDDDGDGYGVDSTALVSCEPPDGYAPLDGDCADWDPTRYPGRFEYMGDGEDEDCDGEVDNGDLEDADIILVGESAGAIFAQSIALAGDGNDDGYPDLLVGARLDDTAYTDAGKVCFYSGVTPGSSPTPYATLLGESSYDSAGNNVTSAGDVNDDGFEDYLVGAYRTGASSSSEDGHGTVYLVHGPVSGEISLRDSRLKMHGVSDDAYAGIWLDGLEDLNDDGVRELLIGAYNEESPTGTRDVGAAYVVYGDSTGSMSLGGAPYKFYGTESIGTGTRVRDGRDLNADGLPSLVISAYHEALDHAEQGAVSLVFDPSPGSYEIVEMRDTVIWPESGYANFGATFDIGDANDDGYGDILVGASGSPTIGYVNNAVYLFHGPFTEDSTRMRGEDARFEGASSGRNAGDSVNFAGDFNGDGSEDLFVGGRGEVTTEGGWAWLIPGPFSAGVSNIGDVASVTLQGEAIGDWAGSPVEAGDLDADGNPDLLVSAFYSDRGGVNAGALYILFGSGD